MIASSGKNLQLAIIRISQSKYDLWYEYPYNNLVSLPNAVYYSVHAWQTKSIVHTLSKNYLCDCTYMQVKVVTVPGSHHMHLIRPEGMYKVVDHFLLHYEIHPEFHDQSKL